MGNDEFIGVDSKLSTFIKQAISSIDDCFDGPVPYRGVGYYEGKGETKGIITNGTQVVFDFATLERNNFSYTSLVLESVAIYTSNTVINAGQVYGFRSRGWGDFNSEYKGLSGSYSAAFAPNAGIEAGAGWERGWSATDGTIRTSGRYWNFGFNFDITGPVDFGFSLTEFTPMSPSPYSYVNKDYTVRGNANIFL